MNVIYGKLMTFLVKIPSSAIYHGEVAFMGSRDVNMTDFLRSTKCVFVLSSCLKITNGDKIHKT